MTVDEKATPLGVSIPAPPSRLGQTATAVVVGVVLLASAADLDIDWGEVWSIPGQIQRYGRLMFTDPDWERLPRALFETWRSISMAWLGAILCVVLSIPLGMLAAHA